MRVALLAVALLLAYAGNASDFSTAADNAAPIRVSKSVDPTVLKEPGGLTYSVTITNDSNSLVWIRGHRRRSIRRPPRRRGQRLFDAPIGLHPGKHVNCMFEKAISGFGGGSHVNTVEVYHDGNGARSRLRTMRGELHGAADRSTLIKDATPTVLLDGLVRYSIVMRNAGPETATNVEMADLLYRNYVPQRNAVAEAPAMCAP